jgi:clan AA aspartic protease
LDITHDPLLMITGKINDGREAIIRLTLYGPSGRQEHVDALVDTGFDGWISLPPSIIFRLHLSWRGRAGALLADGSKVVFDVYEAMLQWHDQMRRVRVDEANTNPLVGMALMAGCELKMQFVQNGSVTIRPLELE